MFEGKHIHFSPADNKPLCSFSNKLCRQRRLNGYAFCIRHILEDKSAPFKRCTYVTRNNNQICLNAIPTNQERGYCHSHMQVAGIIPKTERKIKNPSTKGEAVNGIASNKGDLNNGNSNNSSNNVKKDPNAVFKFEEEHSEIQWIPKGGSINGIVNGGKTNTASKGKDLQVVKKELNGDIPNGIIANYTFGQIGRKNGKVNQTNGLNGIIVVEKGEKNRQTYSKKCATKIAINTNNNNNNGLQSSSIRHRWKDENNKTKEKKNDELNNPVVVPYCLPGHEIYFEQLKTLKTVEKTVIKTEIISQNNPPGGLLNSDGDNGNAAKRVSNDLACKTMSIPSSGNNIQNVNTTTIGVHGFSSLINCKAHKIQGFWNSPESSKRSSETRQEFLARVRQAFKYQYLTLKNSTKESEKNEKIWKRALRNSLISCVVKDSAFCAHVLVQNDPLKYSDLDDGASKISISLSVGNSPKHNKKGPVNGILNVRKGKINVDKNGIIERDLDGGSHEIKNQHIIENSKTTNDSIALTVPNKCNAKILMVSGEKKPKSKASKRSTAQTAVQQPEQLLGIKKTPQATKRKPRKGANTDLLNRIDPINVIQQNIIPGTEKANVSTSSPPYKNNNKVSLPVNQFNGLEESSSSNVIRKKRKFDSCNGIDKDGMDESSTFRIPKLEESSSHFNNIDIKMENGHLLNSNYNAHLHLLSNHSLFHHPHTSSATSTTLAANLQQILNQPDLRTLASHRNQGLDTVLNSVGSSDMGTSDGVITDASFDSTFDHSTSSQQDCEFSDDDLEKSLEFQIDPETEHQASRLLEENEITEDDLNELFPETRLGDNKLGRSSDLSDLGIDFTSTFDANDIDYSLFANIFPFTRTNQSESISVTNQF